MTGIKWSEDYEMGRPAATLTVDVPAQVAVVVRARIIHLSYPRIPQLAVTGRDLLPYTVNRSSQRDVEDSRLWVSVPAYTGAEPAQCEGGKR